jgi:Rrf2 family protein
MVDEIARAKTIPKSFLSKILQKLAKANIVKSYRGVNGGFQLAKKPVNVSLLDVIEATEGSVSMNICAVDKKLCKQSNSCPVHPVWVETRNLVEDRLRRYNFAKLLKHRW